MLETAQLQVYYNRSILALNEIAMKVKEGSIVCLLGSNGAGKSTLLRALAGILPIYKGQVTKGEIQLYGEDIQKLGPEKRVEKGISLVPQGRHIFRGMSVIDNLHLGAYTISSAQQIRQNISLVFDLFPILYERRGQLAGYLSGGEQQMLSIGRALMAQPRLLLLDEPSLGLAPIIIKNIFEKISEIRTSMNMTILIAEQNAKVALKSADYGYILENGQIAFSGPGKDLLLNQIVQKAYLGMESVQDE